MSTASDRLRSQNRNVQANFPLPLAEKQLAALYAGISEAVYIEEVGTGRVVYWSLRAEILFDYPAAQILHQSAARLLAEETQDDRDYEGTVRALDANDSWRGRRQYRRRDGSLFNADVTASLLRADQDAYAVVVVRDLNGGEVEARAEELNRLEERIAQQSSELAEKIEQLQQRETERKQDEQMIGHLLRNISHYAVFTTDANGYIDNWNEAASRLWGYDAHEIFRKHLSLVCPEESGRQLSKPLREAMEQGTSRYYQWIARKDGRRLYVCVVAFALWGEAQVQGFLFLVRDDSRERSLRQKLREKEHFAAIGTAASLLAHEIGNPLNGISATAQLLEHFLSRENLPSGNAMLSSVHDLKSEIGRLTLLLNEFKKIAGPQKLALAHVNLPRLLHQLVATIEEHNSRDRIEVSIECEAELPLLNADEDKLRQALLHVLENAIEAMPHGGRLDVKAYRRDDSVCIDISDTGVGIPENFNVFDLFTSTKPYGIGLGLFMVQQIVLAHDGAISYSSTPGQGTTFHISIGVNVSPDALLDDSTDGI
jgi:PAS domain S-box-containing protein